jgi:hypothetical protein
MLNDESLQDPLLRLMHLDELHAEALPLRPADHSQCDRDRKPEPRQKQFELQRLSVFNRHWTFDETAWQRQVQYLSLSNPSPRYKCDGEPQTNAWFVARLHVIVDASDR